MFPNYLTPLLLYAEAEASVPLGRLTKPQIDKGQEVLQKIEKAIKGNRSKEIEPLSSAFFSLIPTDFGTFFFCSL